MRLVRFRPEQGRQIEHFGSVGFTLAPLASVSGGRVAGVHVEAGGLIGRHPSVGRQVLAVIGGSALVSGADGVEHAIGAGVAAVWEDGEEHETRTVDGFTGVVVEGDGIDVLAPP
jgi:hypothetical protein